jgi:syntaxin-binding protein 1
MPFLDTATEAQVFSLKTPQSFFTLFQPLGGTFGPDAEEAKAAIDEELHFATQSLLNVCVTLNEFPLIRYYNPSHPPLGPLGTPQNGQQSASSSSSSPSGAAFPGSARMARMRGDSTGPSSMPSSGSGDHFTKRLALRLQAAIDAYVKENEPKPEPGRPRGMLFITDRSMDTVAPFLHEFSYQAMCNDLLPITEGNKYKYSFYNAEGQREDKEALLTDDDAVWQGIRHLHIVEAIDKLSRDFKSHAGEAGQFTDNASSLNDMRDMLASLPQMQEMKDKLSLHLTMAQNCMNQFEKTRLPAQAMVEQNCATRTTPEGQKPRTLVEEMVPLLDAADVSNADKVRVIALYIMYSDGVPDEDRRRLFQHARLGLAEMEAVNNLVHLGARVVKDPMNSGWDAWFKKGKRKQISGENEYELSRYQPLVKLMLEDHFAGKLETATYPYVRDGPPESSAGMSGMVGGASGLVSSAIGGKDSPIRMMSGSSTTSNRSQPSSLRSAKPTWHQKGRAGGTGTSISSTTSTSIQDRGGGNRQRVIVFVAGGMTFSEVRSTYQVSERLAKDVYIGSSHVFTPGMFIDNLKHFGKAKSRTSARTHDHDHLPSGATHLSAPVNEISGIRSLAAKARGSSNQSSHAAHHQHPQHHHHHQQQQQQHYDNDLQASQQLYDRRFNTSEPQYPTQQHNTPNQASLPANGGGNGKYHPSGGHHQQTHLHGSPMDRSASPAPSNASDASKIKEKSRLKSLFSSKK